MRGWRGEPAEWCGATVAYHLAYSRSPNAPPFISGPLCVLTRFWLHRRRPSSLRVSHRLQYLHTHTRVHIQPWAKDTRIKRPFGSTNPPRQRDPNDKGIYFLLKLRRYLLLPSYTFLLWNPSIIVHSTIQLSSYPDSSHTRSNSKPAPVSFFQNNLRYRNVECLKGIPPPRSLIVHRRRYGWYEKDVDYGTLQMSKFQEKGAIDWCTQWYWLAVDALLFVDEVHNQVIFS